MAEMTEIHWIPCSEKLPDVDINVLIFYPKWEFAPIQTAHLMSDGLCWEFSDGEFYPSKNDITHWSPLPPPPKDDEMIACSLHMVDTITALMQAVDTIADVYLRMLNNICDAYAKDGFSASADMALQCKDLIRNELLNMRILDEAPRDLPTAVLERIIAEYHRALDAMADQFLADMDVRNK